MGLKNIILLKEYSKWLILIWLVLSSSCSLSTPKVVPLAESGVIDLRTWDFATDGSILLDGEWDFIWGEFPDENGILEDCPSCKIQVPGVWNGTDEGEGGYPDYGFGTYRLKVLLSPNSPMMAIRTREIHSAYELLINGKTVITSGKIGISKDLTVPKFSAYTQPFRPEGEVLSILIPVSNFHHKWAGVRDSIEISSSAFARKSRDLTLMLSYSLLGCALIMGVYHLGLFFLRKKDRSTLYFGLICLIVVSRIFVMGENMLITIFPDFNFDVHLRIIVIGYIAAGAFCVSYLYTLFGQVMHYKIVLAIAIIMGIFIMTVLVTPASIFTRLELIFQGVLLLVFGYSLYSLLKAIIRGLDGSVIVIFGFVALLICAVHDILQAQLVLISPVYQSTLQFGFFIFIFSQSFILATTSTRAQQMASIDYLSQVFNRRRFLELGNMELDNNRRVCSLLSIDADYFKKVNDTYGHAAGDVVLKSLAQTLKSSIRDVDILGRIGGEEFALLLPGIGGDDAMLTANRLCREISQVPMSIGKDILFVTISVGVAVRIGGSDVTLEKFLENADTAMYQAKHGGRNRAAFFKAECP